MARAPALVAAELRVADSRRDLRDRWQRLRGQLARPSSLVAAAAVGALLGVSLRPRGRTGVIASMLASGLIRHGATQLITRCAIHLLRRPSSNNAPNAKAAALTMTGT